MAKIRSTHHNVRVTTTKGPVVVAFTDGEAIVSQEIADILLEIANKGDYVLVPEPMPEKGADAEGKELGQPQTGNQGAAEGNAQTAADVPPAPPATADDVVAQVLPEAPQKAVASKPPVKPPSKSSKGK